MRIKLDSVSKFLNGIMILIFVSLITLGLFLGSTQSTDHLSALVYGILFFGAFFLLKPYIIGFAEKFGEVKCLVSLSVICFTVKLIWVLFIRVVPVSDYGVFFNYAQDLANDWDANNRYVALFPHIFGYSSFLSIFFKLLIPKFYIATGLNVVLSVISGILIFAIAKRLIDLRAAVTAYLFWILCPSQTMYNSLILSDLLYTTFILLFVYIVTEINAKDYKSGKKTIIKMALAGLFSGLLLRAINACRPIAAIFVIALFIWIFVLCTKHLKSKSFRNTWIPFICTLCAVYFLTGPLWNAYMTARIGEQPASVPGYNIYVGFNTKAKGMWNAEDRDLLTYYSEQEGATAQWAQEQMFEEAKDRIFSGDINFTKLFREKIKIFLGADNACVWYMNTYLEDTKSLAILCNAFYYMLLLQCVIGIAGVFNKYNKSTVSILILYVLGLTIAQMLVEVAPRYHYSILPFIILLGQTVLYGEKNPKYKFLITDEAKG